MAKSPVFIDTWALIALMDRKDPWHAPAKLLSQQLHAQRRCLVTSSWVLTEFLGNAAKPPLRLLALKAVKHFQKLTRGEIVPASQDDWVRGFALYESRPDKGWSLVDCLSLLICQDRGIAEVF